MDRWIASSFSQLLSSKDAEKTVAGIKATAEATYSSFIQKDLLRAFIGRSTIPIALEGKKCIIFKLYQIRVSYPRYDGEKKSLTCICLKLPTRREIGQESCHLFQGI